MKKGALPSPRAPIPLPKTFLSAVRLRLPSVEAPGVLLVPFAQDPLYGLRNLHDGHCVQRREFRLLMPLGAGSRALREHFWFYFRGIQCPPKKHLEIPSFDTTVRRRPDRSRPPQVGPAGHTCTESLQFSRRTRRPVCARHTVRAASLARRRPRLTPEVNSGYLPAVGRAPDVARGPRALKNGPSACAPPFALCFGHNLPVHPVLPNRRSREAESGGRGGLVPTLSGNYFPRMPFLSFLPFLPFFLSNSIAA